MLPSSFVMIVQAEKERKLMDAFELKRRIAEMQACLTMPRPWYVRLGQRLSRLLTKEPAAGPIVPRTCCA